MPEASDTASTSPSDIRRAAMDLLARREHARAELIQKLRRRFPSCPEWIDEAVGRLADENLQSDARMAEAFVRSRVNRGQGPLRIRAELRGKGIADDMIDLSFDECGVNWHSVAERVYHKRFGHEAPSDAKERAKRLRFLQGRGFTFDHVDHLF